MNRSISTWKRTRAGKIRRGFTLVELLVVIAIIGLLVGLTVPAVFGVRAAFERSAVKFEVQQLNDSIENYRSKHGDYPPDGSSWPVMERHFRKAFPNMLSSELSLINPANGVQMDPAEALVFFLGGFSTDAQRPFTGKGGPFVNVGTMAAPIYQYNASRDNSYFEFPIGRLTLDASGTLSNDETLFAGATSDKFPVFMSRNNTTLTGTPYVYFDSRTYLFNKGTAAAPLYNCYQPSDIVSVTTVPGRGELGAVRPHLASVSGTGIPVFENNKTFQIITAGKDGKYGGRLVAIGAQWFTTAGQSYTFNGTVMAPDAASSKKYELNENNGIVDRPAHDNASNFTESKTLGENAG